MRHIRELPKILSGYGQLFQEDRAPIDVRYQIVLSVLGVPAASAAHAAATSAPEVAPRLAAHTDQASGHLVVVNRADIWRIDTAAEYQLALANGRRCRVVLHYDPHQPFTKYRIMFRSQDLLL